MMFLPFQILGIWFRGLLALAVLGGGIYLMTRWYDSVHIANPTPAAAGADAPATGSDAAPPVDPTQPRPEPPATADPGPRADAPKHFEFHPGWNRPTALLASAVGLLLWGLLGNVIGRLVGGLTRTKPATGSGSNSPPGSGVRPESGSRAAGLLSDEPRAERTGTVHTIERPDGSTIRVESYGPVDAPPIVATHGWGGNSTSFFYPKVGLTDRFRLIVWDEPGLGLSRKPTSNDFSLEKYARDLDAVLDFAGPRPAVLVGHSIGGMILLVYCRLFRTTLRSKVAGLVLVHTTYKDPVRTTKGATIYTALEKPLLVPMMYVTIGLYPLFWALTWLSYLNGSLHRSTAKSSFAGTETQAQLNFCTSWTPRARPDIVARGMLAMMAFDETATLPTIDVPTLMVVGDKDTTTPPEAGQFIARQVSGSEIVTLTPARHMGLIEQHDQFDPLLARFASSCFAVPR